MSVVTVALPMDISLQEYGKANLPVLKSTNIHSQIMKIYLLYGSLLCA